MNLPNEKALITCFNKLYASLRLLCLHVYEQLESYPLWVLEEGGFKHHRDRVIYALKLLTQKIDVGKQETWSCPGVVACNKETALLIQNVNQLKIQFKKLVQDLKKQHHTQDTKIVRDLLATKGHSGLKLKHVYRQIKYIPHQPCRVAWSKGKAYTSVILSKEQAYHALLKAGEGINIDIQLMKLDLLNPNEKLVKRIPIKSPWIANITHRTNGNTYYQKIVTSLPIFYLDQNKDKLPIICCAKSNHRRSTRRSDQKIEEKPFLESIHAYRYKRHSDKKCP